MSKKVIWITGGSSGIGFATAKYFLKNNWKKEIGIHAHDNLNLALKNTNI